MLVRKNIEKEAKVKKMKAKVEAKWSRKAHFGSLKFDKKSASLFNTLKLRFESKYVFWNGLSNLKKKIANILKNISVGNWK